MMFIGCNYQRVKAEGDGFNAVYTARRYDRGWAFVQQDGTFLTPGIGKPSYYPTWLELWAAVRSRPRVTLKAENFPS